MEKKSLTVSIISLFLISLLDYFILGDDVTYGDKIVLPLIKYFHSPPPIIIIIRTSDIRFGWAYIFQ
jgi:hypothetical protein